ELEYNSSDSTNWNKKRDLFFSVHGIGRGVWGLRQLLDQPTASDNSEPETDGTAPVVTTTISRIIRDTNMSREIKALHHSRCQICGETINLPDGRRYAEAHHIIP